MRSTAPLGDGGPAFRKGINAWGKGFFKISPYPTDLIGVAAIGLCPGEVFITGIAPGAIMGITAGTALLTMETTGVTRGAAKVEAIYIPALAAPGTSTAAPAVATDQKEDN